MKTQSAIYLMFAIFTTGAWAVPMGPSTGGGGFAVVCPKNPVSTATTVLLDLYEGRELLHLKMAKQSGSLIDDYFSAVDRTYTIQGSPNLAEERREEILSNLTNFMQSTKFVDAESELPKAYDLGHAPKVPSQCQIQQAAYYDDRARTIYVLRPLWDQMDSLSQAALVSHELFFHYYRTVGEKKSDNARKAVAQIFSISGLVPIDDGIPEGAAGYMVFSAHEGGDLNTNITTFHKTEYFSMNGRISRFQFGHVNGVGQFSKTIADFPELNWNLKFGRAASDQKLISCILQNPNVDEQHSAPISGFATAGYVIHVQMKTGEPIKIILTQNGVQLTAGYIGSCD